MANKLQVQIQETVEELEHRLERAITAVSKEKLEIAGSVISCSASKTHIVWYNMIILRENQCLLKTSSVLKQRKLCNKH